MAVTCMDLFKAQRAAWDAAVAWTFFRSAEDRKRESGAERDRRYPLPTRAKVVTLSSGERVTARKDAPLATFTDHSLPYVRLSATSVLTAADIAALAELIVRPTEPCE